MKTIEECSSCEKDDNSNNLENELKELESIIRRLKDSNPEYIDIIYSLEQSLVQIYKHYEISANKFCNVKCGIDYPLIKDK